MKVIPTNILGVTVSLFLLFIGALMGIFALYWYFHGSALILIIFTLVVLILLFLIIFRILKGFMIRKFKNTYNALYDSEVSRGNKKNEKTFQSDIENQFSDLESEKDKEIDHLKQLEKYRKEFLGNVLMHQESLHRITHPRPLELSVQRDRHSFF